METNSVVEIDTERELQNIIQNHKNANRKGSNVKEGICPICREEITGTDITMGYAENVEGKWVHIHHLERSRKLLSNENIILILKDIDSLSKLKSNKNDKIKEICLKAIENNITMGDIMYAFVALQAKERNIK